MKERPLPQDGVFFYPGAHKRVEDAHSYDRILVEHPEYNQVLLGLRIRAIFLQGA